LHIGFTKKHIVKDISIVANIKLNAGRARRYFDTPLNSKINNSLSEDKRWKQYKIVQINAIGETYTKIEGMHKIINFMMENKSKSRLFIDTLKNNMTCISVAVKVNAPAMIKNIFRETNVMYLKYNFIYCSLVLRAKLNAKTNAMK